uniref:Uncharacterized protein n=1 Tax=Meloidogyne enterolobii TaxID=390850 RepID=A0A6V7WQE9_MELEN|nr:unnamed protein product [Meloidogyne enterolobii]
MKEFERRRSVNGIGKVGSASSLSAGRETETILNPEWLSDDFCSSEELDKLSMCLSEVRKRGEFLALVQFIRPI